MPQLDIGKMFRAGVDAIDKDDVLKCFGKESDPAMRIFAMIGFVGNLQRAQFDKELAKMNLTTAQLNVLLYLMRAAEDHADVTSRDLEKLFHVTNPTMAGILKRLETKGFINRKKSGGDGRTKLIMLSEEAREQTALMRQQLDETKRIVFDDFTEDELSKMYEMLQRLMENLTKTR
ncbi:MAG: MarR family transcriptional regulator [Lachnospiraceae bacterium]|nr:MarR family transcriptional regulator [Lachnospiraceae bacterium]